MTMAAHYPFPVSRPNGLVGSILVLLLLSQYPRRRHRPFLLFLIAVPVFFHRRRSPSHVGGPQEVEYRGAAPLIRQKVPHSPSPLPPLRLLLDPCPHLGLLVLPLRAVLKKVVPRLRSTTNILRVAPPAVLFRYTPVRACPDLSW